MRLQRRSASAAKRRRLPLRVAVVAAALALGGFALQGSATSDARAVAAASAQAGLERSAARAATGEIIRVDDAWHCTGPVDLDLVKVTMKTVTDRARDAVFFDNGCTGRIDRIEIETWQADGVKIRRGARDLVVGGGFIKCNDLVRGVHQDGVQAMSGQRITFNDLEIDCQTANNAAFFVSGRPGRPVETVPADIVCNRCLLLPANSTVNLKRSIRSGVKDSTVCEGRTAAIRIQEGAVSPLNSGNVVLSERSSRCA